MRTNMSLGVLALGTALTFGAVVAWGLPAQTTHYRDFPKTPINMTLAGHLTQGGQAAKAGVEIAVRNSHGALCGASGVDGANGGAFILHVYGDDPTTPEVDGAVAGEELTLEVFDPQSGTHLQSQMHFSSAGFNEPPAFPPKFTDRASYGMDVSL